MSTHVPVHWLSYCLWKYEKKPFGRKCVFSQSMSEDNWTVDTYSVKQFEAESHRLSIGLGSQILQSFGFWGKLDWDQKEHTARELELATNWNKTTAVRVLVDWHRLKKSNLTNQHVQSCSLKCRLLVVLLLMSAQTAASLLLLSGGVVHCTNRFQIRRPLRQNCQHLYNWDSFIYLHDGITRTR